MLGVAYITILIGSPLWLTLTIIGIYVLYYVLEMYLMVKFNKEM